MDLLVIETGNGGDLVKTSKDLQTIDGLENMVYLALFGGNVEASAPVQRLPNELDYSFWGNIFLTPNERFNSETERTLNTVALNSAGRLQILEAMKRDLSFMNDFADITPDVIIEATDRVRLEVKVQQPGNIQDKTAMFIWDATKAELQAILSDVQTGRGQQPPAPPSPSGTGIATIKNSNNTYHEEVLGGDTLVLDDTTYKVYINDVLQATQVVPSMIDYEINVDLS